MGARITALEFAEWYVYMSREELHPHNDRIRHAELRAAVYTGPAKPPNAAGWSFTDVMDEQAWPAPEQVEAPVSMAEQIALLNRMAR